MSNWSQYLLPGFDIIIHEEGGKQDDKENTQLDTNRRREAGELPGKAQDSNEGDSTVSVYTGD